MKKFLSILLVFCALLGVFVSCDSSSGAGEGTTAAETTTAATTADPAKPLSDKLYVGYGRANITPRDENGSVMAVKLAGYPDEDLTAWRDYHSQMPSWWINSYDEDLNISNNRLYNLNAIPSLYLLDSEKRVLIKDGVSVAHIEDVLSIIDAE
jgi:hypothetical protein